MALSVASDVVHAAAYMYRHVEIGNLMFEGTRVFQVGGLSDGSSNAAATFTARAQRAPGIPAVGNLHPDSEAGNAGCVVRAIRTQPIPQSDDSCYVLVDYWTIIPQFTGGVGIISVERDAALSFETGDRFYRNDGSGQQILILPPRNVRGAKPVPGERSVGLPLRKMIVTVAVTQQNLSGIETKIGTVNGDTGNWFGLPRGYWRFDRTRDTTQLGSGTIICVTEFLTRNTRNWHSFDVWRSDVTGQPVSVDPQDVTSAVTLAYTYGVTQFQGITVIGDYPAITFGQGGLFGRSSYP